MLFLLSISYSGLCQELFFKNYSINEGLPSSRVFQIRAASNGELWMATDNGIARFNGLSFKTYGQEEGLTQPVLFCMTEDNHQQMWFASLSGEIFVVRGDSVYPSDFNDTLPELTIGTNINGLIVRDDTICLSLDRIPMQLSGNRTVKKLIPEGVEESTFYYMYEQPDNQLLYGRVGRSTDSTRYYLYPSKGAEIKGHFWNYGPQKTKNKSAIRLRNGDIVLTFQKELIKVKKNGIAVPMGVKTTFSTASLFEDRQGKIWAGTLNDGVYMVDPREKSLKIEHYLQGLSVTSICQDLEGGIWLSTLESGIFYSPLPGLTNINLSTGLENKRITALCKLRDTLFAGTITGKVWKDISGDASAFSFVTDTEQEIWDMHTDGTKLYFARDPGVHQLNSKGEITRLFLTTNKRRLIAVGGGRLFGFNGLGSSAPGFYAYDIKTQQEKHVSENPLKVKELTADEEGHLWIGAITGLFLLDQTSAAPSWQLRELFKANVAHIFIHGDSVFVATKDRGFAIMDRELMQPEFYGVDQGLPSNQCRVIYQSKAGEIWVATNNGISRFQKHEGTYQLAKNYNEFDGIEIRNISAMEEVDDQLILASENGLWRLPLKESHFNAVSPKIQLDYIGLVEGRNSVSSDLKSLTYNQNNLEFGFSGLAFRNGEKMQYRYRLKGFDPDYRVTSDQQVYYTSLPAGNYTFEVQAANSEGLWSEHPATISFTIPQPWWETWWFYTASGLLSLQLVYWAATVRNRNRNRRNAMQLAMVESEQKALSSQINPHFLYNSLNSAQFYINNNKSDKASDHLANFSILMRKVLQNTSNSFVTVKEELSILRLYLELEQERFDNKFEFSFEVDETIKQENLQIPSMVLQPHVENAIWHGLMRSWRGDGHIRIKLDRMDADLQWSIKDNGVGREEAAKNNKKHRPGQHVSSGVRLTRERLELLSTKSKRNYKLDIIDLMTEEMKPAGTEVVIQMPVDEIKKE